MSEDNKSVVRQFLYEVINKHDPEARPDLLDSGFTAHFGGMPAMDHAGWTQMAGMFFTAFPDLSLTIEDEFSEGDRVAVRWMWTATHEGDLMGVAATGKPIVGTGMGVYRVQDGKLAEEWVVEDMLGVMQQLGATGPAT